MVKRRGDELARGCWALSSDDVVMGRLMAGLQIERCLRHSQIGARPRGVHRIGLAVYSSRSPRCRPKIFNVLTQY